MAGLDELRTQIDKVNLDLLELLSQRGRLVEMIGKVHEETDWQFHDAAREEQMLHTLVDANKGPYPDDTIKRIFQEVFRASLQLEEKKAQNKLLVSRDHKQEDTVIKLDDVKIGGGTIQLMAGPCAFENEEQIKIIAREMKRRGVRIFRGGAFKPRSSPYAFQGLGLEGLKMMRDVCKENDLISITEVLDTRHVEMLGEYADILQVGARNMQNFALLTEVGRQKKPVMLKRGLCATLEEFLYAAEYIASEGNDKIILCERGIRTYETWTRNTLDISGMILLKQESHLPIIVDISHSAGRRDIAIPLAKAALAAGADGIMVEVHYNPDIALSDSKQQLNFIQFASLQDALGLGPLARV